MFPKRLIDGYRAFQEKRFINEHGRYKLLAEKGQRRDHGDWLRRLAGITRSSLRRRAR